MVDFSYVVSHIITIMNQEDFAMTYEEIFQEIKKSFMKADVSEIKEHLAFQFNIEGEGEGAFYAEVKNGELCIEPYEYYDRDVIFTMPAQLLLDIADGKKDPVAAFTKGQLKIDGSIEKAMILKKFIK